MHISQILAQMAKTHPIQVIKPGRFINPDQIYAFLELVRVASEAAQARWALIGGLALQWHGSPRLSSNCDVACTRDLSFPGLEKVGAAPSGGTIWKNTDSSRMSVLVRADGYQSLFEDAIQNAVEKDGVYVARPEWLAAMKFACVDPSHSLDLKWIMRRHGRGLVDVKKTSDLIHSHLGGQYARTAFSRFMDDVEVSLIMEPDLDRCEYP